MDIEIEMGGMGVGEKYRFLLWQGGPGGRGEHSTPIFTIRVNSKYLFFHVIILIVRENGIMPKIIIKNKSIMSLGKKEPAKNDPGKNPFKPGTKEWMKWNDQNKKEEPKKKKEEPKKKEDKKTTKPPIKTAKDYTAKVKIAKGKAPMTGRISKMHGKNVMNIARGSQDFPSLHEETFAEMFTAKFKNKLS